MTKYKLLKDLPFMQAGEIFDDNDGTDLFRVVGRHFAEETPFMIGTMSAARYEDLPEWFEKVKDDNQDRLNTYYKLNSQMQVIRATDSGSHKDDRLFEIGNYFETEEQAKAAQEYLLAQLHFEKLRDHNQGRCDCAKDALGLDFSSTVKRMSDR